MVKQSEPADLLTDFVDFLCTRPTPEEIRTWHPSPAVDNRISELMWKNQEDALTSSEKQELDNAVQHELFLRVVKARVMSNLVTRS